MIEKVALALITSAWRLRPHFHNHQVVVKMNHPIKQVLQKPKLAGRMVTWFVQLWEFDIQYKPRGPMKTWFMVDFLEEFAGSDQTPQTGGAFTLTMRPTWREAGQESSSKALTMSL